MCIGTNSIKTMIILLGIAMLGVALPLLLARSLHRWHWRRAVVKIRTSETDTSTIAIYPWGVVMGNQHVVSRRSWTAVEKFAVGKHFVGIQTTPEILQLYPIRAFKTTQLAIDFLVTARDLRAEFLIREEANPGKPPIRTDSAGIDPYNPYQPPTQ